MMYEYSPDLDYFYHVHFFSQDLKTCVATEMKIGKFEYLLFRYDKQIRDTGAPSLIISVILPFEAQDMRHISRLVYTNRGAVNLGTEGLAELLEFQERSQMFLDFISFNKFKLEDLDSFCVFNSSQYSFPTFNFKGGVITCDGMFHRDRCFAKIIYLENVKKYVEDVYGWKLFVFSGCKEGSKVLCVFDHGLFVFNTNEIFILKSSKNLTAYGDVFIKDLELVHTQRLAGVFFRSDGFPSFSGGHEEKLLEQIKTIQ